MQLYGGRMTATRLREVGSITTEALEKIHKWVIPTMLLFYFEGGCVCGGRGEWSISNSSGQIHAKSNSFLSIFYVNPGKLKS